MVFVILYIIIRVVYLYSRVCDCVKRKEPEQEVAQVEVKTKALHYLARAQDPYRVKIRN